MEASDISKIKDNEVVNIVNKVGNLGSSVKSQIIKNVDRFTDTVTYVVITREGFLKFWGNALIASFEGEEGKDKITFNTPASAAKYLNS